MAATQNDFKVLTNLVVRGTATIATVDSFVTTGTSAPLLLPSLNLNFVASNTLDTRINFTRSSGATYVGKNGLIQYAGVNQPRLDFDPVNTGTNLGLFIEEQRTNIHFYSAQAGLSVNNGNCKFTTATVIAPDGSLADIVNNTPSVNSFFYNQSNSIMTPLTYYTRSVYAKTYGGSNTIIFENYINGGNTYCQFNLATGAISNNSTGTAYMVNAGNGWYRCIWTVQSSASASDFSKVTYIGGYGSTPLTTPIAVWGSQLEAGAWPTSYIPTGASQVTRQGDTAYLAGQNFNSWYNPVQGSLYAEFQQESNLIANRGIACINDGTINNVAYHLWDSSNTPGQIFGEVFVNGTGLSTSAVNYSTGTLTKAVQTISGASNRLAVNGTLSTTAAGSTWQQPVVNQLRIGDARFSSPTNGWIKRLMFFPQALTNQQMITLTTGTTFTSTNFVNTVLATNARTPDFQVDNGVLTSANLEVSDIDKLYATTLQRPTQQPSLNLNFLKGTLDSRINFSRASGATVVGANGLIQYVGNNVPRFDYSSTSTGTCLGLLIEETRTNYFANTGLIGGGAIAKNAGTAIGPDGLPAHKFTVGGSAAVSYPGWGGNVANYTYSVASGTVITASFTGYFGPGFGNQALEPHIVIQFSVGGVSNTLYNEVQINTGTWTLRQNSFPAGITQVIAPTITRMPTGMYKVSYSIKYTDDGTLRNTMGTYIQVRDTSLSGTYATDGTSGIQFACLQTEVGAFPTSYIPTESTSVTRATDYAYMNGQNFNSWYNQNAGTFYVEHDGAFSTVTNNYPRVLHVGDGSVQSNVLQYIYGLSTTPGQSNLIWADWYNGNFVQSITVYPPLVFGATYKTAMTYSLTKLTGSISGSAVQTANLSQLPTIANQMGIGGFSFLTNSSQVNGHMRKITYYPEQLNNTQTLALTVG